MIIKKTAIEIYTSLGEPFSEESLAELSRELCKLSTKEITVKQDVTPDGMSIIFIIEEE